MLIKLADHAYKYIIRLLLHTCGYIEPLIPRLIELGVDIPDPIVGLTTTGVVL